MKKLVYHDVTPISRSKAEAVFAGSDSDAIVHALLSLAYHDRDWRWVQEWCIRFAKNSDPILRNIAAVCFAHLARIHRTLDTEKVIPILNDLANDPQVAGNAIDALSDIRHYLRKSSH